MNKEIELLTAYCDECGGECIKDSDDSQEYCEKCGEIYNEGYNIRTNNKDNKETEIKKIVSILKSYGDDMVDEIIKQIYEIRRVNVK